MNILPSLHGNHNEPLPSLYELYANELLPCIFCDSIINLYYINSHMKTCKCKKLQVLYKKVHGAKIYNQLILEHKRNVNKIKSDVKLNDIQQPQPQHKEDILLDFL